MDPGESKIGHVLKRWLGQSNFLQYFERAEM